MTRVAGRTADETRQLILEAAARLISERGTAVPLAEIAADAGVSKGGLLYHFPTKEELLRGLASSLMTEFRQQVQLSAESEQAGAPGRLTRAYIRVCFAYAEDINSLRDFMALAVHLMLEPDLEEVAKSDAAIWREQLFNDGLSPEVVRLVVAATDGRNTTPLWGAVLNEEDTAALEEYLLALTCAGGENDKRP